MTSLTTALARAVGRARLGPGTNLVVTSLDHDANVTPWTTVAGDTGAEVRQKYKKSSKGKWVHSIVHKVVPWMENTEPYST